MYTHDQRCDLFAGDLPGSVVQISGFQCRSHVFDPWSGGAKIPRAVSQKKKKNILYSIVDRPRKFKNKINVHNGGMIKLTMVTQVRYR